VVVLASYHHHHNAVNGVGNTRAIVAPLLNSVTNSRGACFVFPEGFLRVFDSTSRLKMLVASFTFQSLPKYVRVKYSKQGTFPEKISEKKLKLTIKIWTIVN